MKDQTGGSSFGSIQRTRGCTDNVGPLINKPPVLNRAQGLGFRAYSREGPQKGRGGASNYGSTLGLLGSQLLLLRRFGSETKGDADARPTTVLRISRSTFDSAMPMRPFSAKKNISTTSIIIIAIIFLIVIVIIVSIIVFSYYFSVLLLLLLLLLTIIIAITISMVFVYRGIRRGQQQRFFWALNKA